MDRLKALRSGRPASYPDNAIYAQFAAERCNLTFRDHDGGTGLVFSVSNATRTAFFGAGKCPAYPQNDSTSAYLATDKYFANRILSELQIPNLGGEYFFLHDRFRSLRMPGHERLDALEYLKRLGGQCFVKPLTGSRGDFAQRIDSPAALQSYIEDVQRYHDAIIIQEIAEGTEYRVFVQDDAVVYCTRKTVPQLRGDGVSTVAGLLGRMDELLAGKGTSIAARARWLPPGLSMEKVLAKGETIALPGRANLSAGGTMTLADPRDRDAAFSLAIRATRALGLRLAGVDLFAAESEGRSDYRVIELNSNPSVRFLEEISRTDLLEKIWRGTFAFLDLIDD